MRNIIGRAAPDENEDANQTPENHPGARISGGSMGVPGEASPNMAGSAPAPRPSPKVRKYRVVTGGYLMQNNCRVVVRAGKEIHDHQFDIKMLERQGIRLEEITEPDPEPEAPAPRAASPEPEAPPPPASPPPPVEGSAEEQEQQDQKRRRGR